MQPRGPYRIGGLDGWVVAFEMARQLDLAGESVSLLALVDSHLPVAVAGEPMPFFSPARRLEYFLKADARGKLDSLSRFVRRQVGRARRAGGRQPDTFDPVKDWWRPGSGISPDLWEVLVTNQPDYSPEPYPGGAVYFRAEKPMWPGAPRDWSSLIKGPIEVFDVPGDHDSCMREPYVSKLGGILREHLRQRKAVASAR